MRRACLSVLDRAPDPGRRRCVGQVIEHHWTERDLARGLRNSEEYRSRHRR